MPIVCIMTPGFISRAFLIQRARCGGSFGNRPAAIVVRDARCVRFGPMLPTIIGLPRMGDRRDIPRTDTSFTPFAGSPFASRFRRTSGQPDTASAEPRTAEACPAGYSLYPA